MPATFVTIECHGDGTFRLGGPAAGECRVEAGSDVATRHGVAPTIKLTIPPDARIPPNESGLPEGSLIEVGADGAGHPDSDGVVLLRRPMLTTAGHTLHLRLEV